MEIVLWTGLTFRVDANTIHGRWLKFHSSPLFDSVLGSIPDLLLKAFATTTEIVVLDAHHVSRSHPVVRVDIACAPPFVISFVFVAFPVFVEKFPDGFRCLYLHEACRGEILEQCSKTV